MVPTTKFMLENHVVQLYLNTYAHTPRFVLGCIHGYDGPYVLDRVHTKGKKSDHKRHTAEFAQVKLQADNSRLTDIKIPDPGKDQEVGHIAWKGQGPLRGHRNRFLQVGIFFFITQICTL